MLRLSINSLWYKLQTFLNSGYSVARHTSLFSLDFVPLWMRARDNSPTSLRPRFRLLVRTRIDRRHWGMFFVIADPLWSTNRFAVVAFLPSTFDLICPYNAVDLMVHVPETWRARTNRLPPSGCVFWTSTTTRQLDTQLDLRGLTTWLSAGKNAYGTKEMYNVIAVCYCQYDCTGDSVDIAKNAAGHFTLSE